MQVHIVRTRPLFLVGVTLFLLVGGLGLSLRTPSHAKQQNVGPTPLPSDVQELMSTVDDIGELRTITPLKLTPDQIDKIVAYVNTGQAEYSTKNNDLVSKTIRGLADTIKKAKKEALQGKPAQGEEQVLKAMNSIQPKRSQFEVDAMNVMCDKILAILTPKQQETMAKVAKDALPNTPDKKSITTSNLCKLYIYRVFVGYSRAPKVLMELKAEIEPN